MDVLYESTTESVEHNNDMTQDYPPRWDLSTGIS